MTKREKRNRRRRLKRIKDVIYGELEMWTEIDKLPKWFHDCVGYIAVQLDGRFRKHRKIW